MEVVVDGEQGKGGITIQQSLRGLILSLLVTPASTLILYRAAFDLEKHLRGRQISEAGEKLITQGA